jgi:hypothetical protein
MSVARRTELGVDLNLRILVNKVEGEMNFNGPIKIFQTLSLLELRM